MPSQLDQMYAHSPTWLQNIGVSLYGMVWRQRRFGGVFPTALQEFIAREEFDTGQWDRYQSQVLWDLLAHSARFVPYYRESWADAGIRFNSQTRRPREALAQLPLLSKETIRANQSQFTAETAVKTHLHTYLTSGTTGTPLAIQFTTRMHQTWSAAYEARCRRWAGVDHSLSRAMIGGRLVVPKANAKPPFWRYNVVERQLYMSAFHISPANAPYYVEALNHYRPDYLVGYASSHFFLARLICELDLKVHQPRAVLTSSEKLTPEMRRTIEQAYGCSVFDAYSGVEACCLASECEHHQLHLSPDVGIVELVDESGQPVPPGEPGEIVATGLLNFAQPLIRYRTGDLAVLSDTVCPCGRQMPVLRELVGRLEDTVVGPDGREMVRFHGIFVGLPHVQEGQVIQETVSRFRLRLVVDPEFNSKDRHMIARRFEERLGPVEISFELVDQIERTERGKFRAVISKVPRKYARVTMPALQGY